MKYPNRNYMLLVVLVVPPLILAGMLQAASLAGALDPLVPPQVYRYIDPAPGIGELRVVEAKPDNIEEVLRLAAEVLEGASDGTVYSMLVTAQVSPGRVNSMVEDAVYRLNCLNATHAMGGTWSGVVVSMGILDGRCMISIVYIDGDPRKLAPIAYRVSLHLLEYPYSVAAVWGSGYNTGFTYVTLDARFPGSGYWITSIVVSSWSGDTLGGSLLGQYLAVKTERIHLRVLEGTLSDWGYMGSGGRGVLPVSSFFSVDPELGVASVTCIRIDPILQSLSTPCASGFGVIAWIFDDSIEVEASLGGARVALKVYNAWGPN